MPQLSGRPRRARLKRRPKDPAAAASECSEVLGPAAIPLVTRALRSPSKMSRVPTEEADDEGFAVQRGADYRHDLGAGGRDADCQCVLKAWRQRRPAQEAVDRADAGQRYAEGSQHEKILTPASRREAVAYLCESFEVSRRRACSLIGVVQEISPEPRLDLAPGKGTYCAISAAAAIGPQILD
jgi:hypothetical protein